MTLIETLIKLRDDIKLWVTNNLRALAAKKVNRSGDTISGDLEVQGNITVGISSDILLNDGALPVKIKLQDLDNGRLDVGEVVTLEREQTITGAKTFTEAISVNDDILVNHQGVVGRDYVKILNAANGAFIDIGDDDITTLYSNAVTFGKAISLDTTKGKFINSAGGFTFVTDDNLTIDMSDVLNVSGEVSATVFTEDGKQLSDKYLGINSKAASAVVADKATNVKSTDAVGTITNCRVALLVDASGMDNDSLIKTADLKYDVVKKSLIVNGTSLSGTYRHEIEFETSLGDFWIPIVDNHAAAYNDTTFREKYQNAYFFNGVGRADGGAVFIGQLGVNGEFYGIIAYADGKVNPIMENVSFTVVSDTVID